MIILKHITIERFRLLRSMNLHFPQRGSILIQGPNEAGKSALIESIYFALYGEPLLQKRGSKRSLDDLILYGTANAQVTLTLAVGATELEITRTIERGIGQHVSLLVRRLGIPDEAPITNLTEANQRVISELELMDGETLRNACLVEQKGLARLETISGKEREATVRKLLGLEKLLELREQFQVVEQDEERLKESAERLQLAEIQARIPQLSQQLHVIEESLEAVNVCDLLAEIEEQDAEVAELERTLEQIRTKRIELKSRQGRIQQLKRADATLSTIISSYEDIAEARTTLPELEKEIAELERREHEELPKLEKRVNDLAELSRSFGTLQRMSNDLLAAVDSIKDLEQEVRQHNEIKQDLLLLNEQVASARARLGKTQQSLQELEERRRAGRPQLEERLQRLHALAQSLTTLHNLEQHYTQRMAARSQAAENAVELKKIRNDLEETEQELALVEREAQQVQQRADIVEKSWRQLSMRRQVEEWHRLKGLAQGLAMAQQHVDQAYQRQAKLTQARGEAQAAVRKYIMILVACGVVAALCVIGCIIGLANSSGVLIAGSVLFLIIVGAIGYWHYMHYKQSGEEERRIAQQEQEATSNVGMMVTAREAALRMGGSPDSLRQVENEIRALGSNAPRTLEEAQQFLEHMKNVDLGSLGNLQQQMKEKLDDANAARNQVNVTMEAVAALRKERTRLEELRQRERWDEIDEDLYNAQTSVERMQQEITLLAGQENLPMASINARLQASPVTADPFTSGSMLPIISPDEVGIVPDLEGLVESTVKATERELATMDGKLDIVNDLTAQARAQQDELDRLLIRQQGIEEQEADFRERNPALQIERAREQQTALRSALQSLQDSLRQRVKPLGVIFGQAAIGNAENLARKQLEELQIVLGNKIMLQERHAHFTILLKERQESLAEHYKQLAKFSNSLGSWIVPLNPFAEALAALRTRCQRELQEANENGILQELENLQHQEGASHARIALCQQAIEQTQEEISGVLKQHNRPQPKTFALTDLTASWPLLGKYTRSDRTRLEEQRSATEQELNALEKQELEMSTRLGTLHTPLDLEETRASKEQQERAYETRKRGNLLINAVDTRLLRKMLPRTEYYMQQILPLLTGGRYHDVHLTTEPETDVTSGGPYQIQVWDSAAGEYLPTSALSVGAADQLSLALRLAFAIAVLPRELSAAPGFVFLDEPLSSFDRGRTQALVDVVTGDVLSQHFEQIFLVSHSNAFDPAMFPYHIYMDNGLIVESNLPVVPNLSVAGIAEVSETPIPVAVGASTQEVR